MTEHELKTWKEQCHDQANQLVEMRDMLLKLEWAGGQDSHGCGICPECDSASGEKHESYCELNKLLEPYR